MFREFFSRWKQPKPAQTNAPQKSTPEFLFSKEPRRLVAVGSEKSSGAFARVYDSEIPGMVVKRGSTIRDGYVLWLSYILDHGPNPMFPRVYAIHVDRRLGEFWVLMEKLQSQGGPPVDKRGRVMYNEDMRLNGGFICDYDGKLSGPDHKTLSDVFDWLSSQSLFPDMHSNNWMMRGEQPVLTDPISYICGCGSDTSTHDKYLRELEEVCLRKKLTLLTYGD